MADYQCIERTHNAVPSKDALSESAMISSTAFGAANTRARRINAR
jgi:hypothetical protein